MVERRSEGHDILLEKIHSLDKSMSERFANTDKKLDAYHASTKAVTKDHEDRIRVLEKSNTLLAGILMAMQGASLYIYDKLKG